MEQVIIGGVNQNLDPSSNVYNSLEGGSTWGTVITYGRSVVSANGKIKNLRVILADSPGAGTSYDFILWINGATTALTLEIADAATSNADITHEVDVVVGDLIQLRCEPTNTPTLRTARWTSMFEGSTEKESLILGGTGFEKLYKTSIEYSPLMGKNSPSTIEDNKRQICPTAGKIKNLYVELSTDPGTAPDAYKFTLRKNGSSQTLTVTITANDRTGNDTVNEVTVAAGDELSLIIEPLNTPASEPASSWGMTFVADIDGESITMGGHSQGLNTSSTKYNPLQTTWSSWDIESNKTQLAQVCTLKKLYVGLSAAPGAGKRYTFTVRIAGGSSNVVAEVVDTATTGNSGALEDTIVDDDYVNLECTPVSTPAAANAFWGLVGFLGPAAVGLENKSGSIAAKLMAAGLI